MTSHQNMEDLLAEVDALFPSSGEEEPWEEPEPVSARRGKDEVLMVYRNLSHGQHGPSGKHGPPIPARNGDRTGKKSAAPLPGGAIPAYNADVRRLRTSGEMEDTDVEELLNRPDLPRKGKFGCGCVPVLLLVAAALALVWYFRWGM